MSRKRRQTRLNVESLEDRWVPVAPINSLPGSQSTLVGTPLAFSAANGNGLSFTDPDGPGPFQVEIVMAPVAAGPTNVGTVAAGTTTGLTVSGNGTNSLTLNGTLSDLLAALDTIVYTPTAGFSGQARMVFETHDENSGGLADTDFITINVSLPVATLRGTASADTDNDGVRDAGESGVGGALVLLDANADGTSDAVATTDANGEYVFADISPGAYRVQVIPPSGSIVTTPPTADRTLAVGDDVAVDFGVFTPATPPTVPGALVRSASGANAASIQAAVDAFRADLGTLNPNQAGSFGSGRREINWDGVPAQFASPNALPANFFNSNSPRGVELAFGAGSAGTGFQVSGRAADAGTGQPDVRFNTLNATYDDEFQVFSAERLFTSIGDNDYDVVFFVPGTATPAKVRGFGAVFTDVGSTPSTIELFAPDGASLGVFTAQPADDGLSFIGAIDSTGAGVARVRITTGNTPLGPNDGGAVDVVALDDFIFGEPVAINTDPGIGDVTNQTAGGTIPVTVFDTETPSADLQLAVSSSNSTLFPAGSLVLGGSGSNRTLTLTPAANVFATATITLTVTDAGGLTATDTFELTVQKVDLFAVATGPGVPVQVNVFNADATLRFTLSPFGSFSGGATVATGDVNDDGVEDVVVGAGPGAGPHVKVFDGKTGTLLHSHFAFSPDFYGGIFVGAGDVTGDGAADIVVGAGAGAGPHVKVFDGKTLAEVRSFFAFDSKFTGGVSVRAGDIDGDGAADIVVGAGPGGAPHVKAFSGADLSELQSFFAGPENDRNGVLVGIGKFDPASPAPQIVASVSGTVRRFAPPSGSSGLLPYIEQDNFTPFGPGVAAAPAAIRQADGIIAILIGAVGKAGPHVQIIDGTSNTIRSNFFAFDSSFTGGVAVG